MPTPDFDSLTPRERECLLALSEVDDAKAVARQLNLSPYTINNHLQSAMRKLGVRKSERAARLYRGHVGLSEKSLGQPSPVDLITPEPPSPVERRFGGSPDQIGQLREERTRFAFDTSADNDTSLRPMRRRGEFANRLSSLQRFGVILGIALGIALLGLLIALSGSALTAFHRHAIDRPSRP